MSVRWLRTVVFVGLLYLIIGLGFSALARQGGRAWNLVAWAVSAIVFVAHLRREMAVQRNSATLPAFHAALAVALGGLGLAVAATIHALRSASFRAGFVVALVVWPLMLGVAAFLTALVVVTTARRLARSATGSQ